MAEGSGAVWTMQVSGNHDDGSPFITAMFTYAGGVGARATKPGSTPARTRPASPPCRSRWSRRRHRSASARRRCGPAPAATARQTGGLGQTIEFSVDTTRPWQLNAVTSRLAEPAAGHLRRRGRGRRAVQRQRHRRHDPGPHHAAARRRRAPRAPGRRRLRGSRGDVMTDVDPRHVRRRVAARRRRRPRAGVPPVRRPRRRRSPSGRTASSTASSRAPRRASRPPASGPATPVHLALDELADVRGGVARRDPRSARGSCRPTRCRPPPSSPSTSRAPAGRRVLRDRAGRRPTGPSRADVAAAAP